MNKKYNFLLIFFWFLLLTPQVHAIVLDTWEGDDFVLRLIGQGRYLGHPREYYKDLDDEERSAIRYIVTMLANEKLIWIGIAKSDLETAGTRIEHLHPLRFLMTIFTDEELKVGIRNIRGRGWIWNHFAGGLKESLATETHLNNMHPEMIAHFAGIVKIDQKIIYPAIVNQRWDEFIDLLITHIPRKGDHNRFDTRSF
jgi:hypothetical protein